MSHGWGGLQRAPPVQQPKAYPQANGGYSSGDEGDDAGETPWYEVEIETLKSSLKALNMQIFQQRKTWLAEKTELEHRASSISSSPAPSVASMGGTTGAASMMRRGGIERSPALERGGLPAAGGGRVPSSGGAAGNAEEVASLRMQLSAALAERDAARAEAQRWTTERAALQREIMVLRASGGGGLSAEDEDRFAALEDEKAALQAELDMMKESLKTHVMVPKAHMANMQKSGSFTAGSPGSAQAAAVAAAAAAASSTAAASISRVSTTGGTPRTSTTGGGPSLADTAATIAKLNGEITRLQADLYILKNDFAQVPKAEYKKLQGVNSERAALEQELRSLKMELADVNRLNKMLRDEMELIKEEHMAITMQEYDALRKAAAEKSALEMKLEAQSKYYAQVPREELAELQSARSKVVSLETKLAAMQAMAAVGADEKHRALQATTNEAAELRVKVMDLEAMCAELRKEVKAGEGRTQVINDLRDNVRVGEIQLQAAQQEKARAALRLKALQEELETVKRALREAQADNARLAGELGSLRDAHSSMAQEVSQLARERGEQDAQLAEFKTEYETLTNELVDAKLELARLREMEVVYKKSVLAAKKQLYGTPSQDPGQ